jgi:hypothetical protein
MKSWMLGACVMALMLGHMEICHQRQIAILDDLILAESKSFVLSGLTEEEAMETATRYWVGRYEKNPEQFRGGQNEQVGW